MTQREIAKEYCKNYPVDSKAEIARMIFADHPGVFKDVEAARYVVRVVSGSAGKENRERMKASKPVTMLNGNPAVSHGGQFLSDKKIGSVNWRELCNFATEAKRLKSKAGWSQSTAELSFPADRPLGIVMLSDLHALSYGTDHSALVRIIDEILAIPGLMIGLVGDLIQMSIKLRSVLEVSDNVMSPEMQMMWLESFLEEIKDRVVFATWDNHSVEREEKASGISMFKWLLSRRVIYTNGIGHLDMHVGDQIYKIAVTHKVRGRSMLNKTHGQQRYMRFEGVDREIMIAGDSHEPGISHYTDGQMQRLAVNCGALQTSSGYAQRYFSLYTHPVFPIVTLRPDRHEFSGDWTLASWVERQKGFTK